MSEISEHDAPSGGMTRRAFVTRSAAVGGMVWAAPAISTLGSRAFAETNGTPRNCHAISYLALVIDTKDDGRFQFKQNKGGACEHGGEVPQCPVPSGWQKQPSDNLNGCGIFTVDTTDDCCWTVTIPGDIEVESIVGVAMGAGGDNTEQGYCVTADITAGRRSYQFCAPNRDSG